MDRAPPHSETARARNFIARGFEHLLCTLAGRDANDVPDFDVVIVGSGYGGSIAAAELAGYRDAHSREPLRVCVLERGEEYLPGSFPDSESTLPGQVRFSTPEATAPRGVPTGLFDIRVGDDVCTLLANGLGGGSLINAGVLAEPTDEVLAGTQWPVALRGRGNLADYYARARELLRAAGPEGNDQTISDSPSSGAPLKFVALERLAGPRAASFSAAKLATAMVKGPNAAGVELEACIRCGNCATGCNERAKNSLDENLLVQAWRHGADIYTGATVLKLARASDTADWLLDVVHTDPRLRRQHGETLRLRARRVILAAGTLGSTEILLRSRSDTLQFSARLGMGFSGNGDMFAVAHAQSEVANALAVEHGAESSPPGPSITGMLDLRHHAARMMVQEFAIPGALGRLFRESFTLAHTLHQLGRPDRSRHLPEDPGHDPCAVDERAMQRTLPLGVMGHDDSSGRIELVGTLDTLQGDGAVRVRWPRTGDERDDQRLRALAQLVEDSGTGGEILSNPIARLLPEELGTLLGTPRGPSLTVHPLGGCWIAEDARHGVVDHLGRVFDPTASGDAVHEGLIVLDGSIVPGSLGINPSLTIAALALRAVTLLRQQWLALPLERTALVSGRLSRPIYRVSGPRPEPVPTKVTVSERLTGTVPLQLADGSVAPRVVQLTLRFAPIELRALMSTLERTLVLQAGSELRVFEPRTWQSLCNHDASEVECDARAELIADLTGTLRPLHREASSEPQRRWRALFAWLRNRGVRDVWQALVAQFNRAREPDGTRRKRLPLKIFKRAQLALNLASRAGEVRRFDYDLQVAAVRKSHAAHAVLEPGSFIRGHKRFTYACLSNPWLQLQELQLSEFPGLQRQDVQRALLSLDTRYLARLRVPLLQVVQQADGARALFDMASFLLYVLRLVVTIHVWSFRRPDAPVRREPLRLAGSIPGVPPPHIRHLRVSGTRGGSPAAYIQLTRYARGDAAQPPVLLIHGYSANGTSFTHPAVEPNLAGYLWNQGRDVWVVDLRTSSGMLTAQEPWTFEDVAYADIPAAIEHILQATCASKVDVIAHCMGAAMFSMALLGRVRTREPYARIRSVLPRRIRSAVLLQVAPKIVFTPENVFRAYAMSYVRSALQLSTYQMRPSAAPSVADDVLDRLLSTVPYPLSDRAIEMPRNPLRSTAFAGTRHRMDALFGRVFNSANISPRVLAHIDDLFGPICMGTVFQTIHFAQIDAITTHDGRNEFATVQRLQRRWGDLPTLSVHGDDNGLAHVATVHRTAAWMAQAGMQRYRFWVAPGFGHQDVLIGRRAELVFEQIEAFLKQPEDYRPPPCPDASLLAPVNAVIEVELPEGAILRRTLDDDTLRIAFAFDNTAPMPSLVLTLPVQRVEQRFVQAGPLDATTLHPWSHIGGTADWRGPMTVATSHWPVGAHGLLLLLIHDAADGIEAAVHQFLRRTAVADLERAFIPRPMPREGSLCFLVASCQYPSGPLDRRLAEDSYERMAHWLAREPQSAQFLVLTGDQIYADATAGLLDPTGRQERYRARYTELFATPPFQTVLRQLDTYMMLDDHEIMDNWEPGVSSDRRSQDFFTSGVAAYIEYQRRLDPPERVDGRGKSMLWHSCRLHGYEFFFADTRTDRQARHCREMHAASIMSELQFAELTRWLMQHEGAPRFVVSASILLPRRLSTSRLYDAPDSMAGHLRSDAWDGFPDSFRRLLACIARHRLSNVVFLSGDEHLFCAARIELTELESGVGQPPVVVHSIHCSGLYSPFIFANGGTARFAGTPVDGALAFADGASLTTEDEFEFSDPDTPQRFRCRVRTRFAPAGDGFAILRCERDAGKWLLKYEFSQRENHAFADELELPGGSK